MKNTFRTGLLSLTILWTGLATGQIDLSKLSDMKFRSIGPAGMSGRVTAIDVVLNNTSKIYVGTASGGLWMSENEGINWKPIFDKEKDHSIGDVKIYQKNPNIIYVGAGEGNPRNSQSSGNGMYKSIDGGTTWQHIGLENTRNIHRVLIHPDDPDMVWAGVQGSAWAPHPERGVYKTTDGGETWEQILFVNDTTGVADMVMDPSNPNKIMVAMWQFWRRPWYMESGGPGSGIHVTMDGGESWNKITAAQGIPDGELGRVGLAFAPSSPNVVYARIEAKKDGLYRSNNGGQSWSLQASENIGDRPFYYSDIFVDPTNENRIYNLSTQVIYSEDGGKTHQPLMQFFQVHSDHHAWWINPHDPAHMLDGNDGGLYSTRDRGKSWKFHHNLPVGQFYHISVDMATPYNVMGGMQDNGSWSGPAYKWEMMGSIKNSDFRSVGFGDGFDVIADPEDNRYGYSLWQGGRFMRYDKELGLIKMIAPVEQGDTQLRWNWNAAISQDPFDVNTVYVGSQFVHKSTDKGLSWKVISPDLTTNDSTKQQQKTTGGLTVDNTTAENHCSILVIEPSTIERGTMWVGTDDGNVQVTQDGGLTWTNVTENIRESDRINGRERTVPAHTWVPQIKASTYNPASAFVVFDDHRRNNWEPYVYKTDNYGRTWRRMVDGDDMRGYALCIAQDREEPNLIFVGTEFGLYITLDGGKNWEQFKHGLPTSSVMDMVIHPREGDLVVGTFGRSVWVLDDIRPLRELALDTAIVHDTLHMFEPPLAYQAVQGMPAFFSGSSDQFSGTNRPAGAVLNYWSAVKSEKDSVKITVYGNDGRVFRELKHTAKPGLNRLTWDLKKEQAKMPGPPNPFSGFFSNGVEALPGDYMVTVANGDHIDTTEVEIKMDPAMPISMHAFRINLERKGRYQAAVKAAGEAYDRLTETSKQIKKLQDFIADRKDSSAVAVKAAADTLQMALKKLMEECVPTPGKGIAGDTDDLVAQLGRVGMYFFSPMTMPGTQEEAELKKVEETIRAYSGRVNQFMTEDYVRFGEQLEKAGMLMLSIPKPTSKS